MRTRRCENIAIFALVTFVFACGLFGVYSIYATNKMVKENVSNNVHRYIKVVNHGIVEATNEVAKAHEVAKYRHSVAKEIPSETVDINANSLTMDYMTMSDSIPPLIDGSGQDIKYEVDEIYRLTRLVEEQLEGAAKTPDDGEYRQRITAANSIILKINERIDRLNDLCGDDKKIDHISKIDRSV